MILLLLCYSYSLNILPTRKQLKVNKPKKMKDGTTGNLKVMDQIPPVDGTMSRVMERTISIFPIVRMKERGRRDARSPRRRLLRKQMRRKQRIR